MLDRTVSIIPRVITGTDARGNDVITDGPAIEGVPAGRDQDEATEELRRRDEQAETFVYFLPATLDDGTELEVSGYDVILDDGKRYEVKGNPERIVRRRGGRVHHLEAIASLVEG